MDHLEISEEEKLLLIKHCESIIGKYETTAAFVSDIVGIESDEGRYFEVLVVLNNHLPITGIIFRVMKDFYINSILIDSKLFESDILKGLLGEIFSEKITFFYIPLTNEDYLKSLESKLKKRLIRERIERLIIEYPEFYREFLIKPEYFVYDLISERCKLAPFLSYKLIRFIKGLGLERINRSFMEAIQSLVDENLLSWSDGYLKIVETTSMDKAGIKGKVADYVKSIKQVVLRYGLGSLPDISSTFLQTLKFSSIERLIPKEGVNSFLGDPEKQIFIPTSRGLVPLSESADINELLKKIVFKNSEKPFIIEKMGGILNSVYLIKWRERDRLERIVVKRFNDWIGFKWLPLALWTFGTKDFAVLGRTRLGREYASNRYLHRRGFPVPEVIYVNLKEKILISEYIDGDPLIKIIKSIFSDMEKDEISVFRRVGETIAWAHKLGVTLGDCKPENFIVADDEKIYFIDLEQTTFDVEYSWDIAEFLYYSGHYLEPFKPVKMIDPLIKEFIAGYIAGGGSVEVVREVSSLKFRKIFSFFTFPHILSRIASICKNFS